jgi:prepilin-type N-terminal cleavage/methylation domain-containing protein
MSPSSHRGFTVLELLVSLAIGVLAISVGLSMLLQQNASLQKASGAGNAMNQNQLSADAIAGAIRLAGTGIDASMAFDFDFYDCTLPGTSLSMTESQNCNQRRRDAVDAPDELVVAYRDMNYSTNWTQPVSLPGDTRTGCTAGDIGFFVGKVWGVTSATATSATLVLKPGDTLYRGQVLQLGCSDGITYTYATISSGRTSVPSTATSCVSTTVNFYSTVTNNPFHQPGYLSGACFSNGSARAYAVKRQRFFIHRTTGATIVHPYLMLDQGLDLDDDGLLTDADLLPIASDIEDLQVAYGMDQVGVMSLATPPTGWATNTYVTDSNRNGVWGDDLTIREQLSEPLVSGNPATAQFNSANLTIPGAGTGLRCTTFASSGLYQYPCLWGITPVEASQTNTIHAYRWTAWPGNIASVKIGIVARSAVASAGVEATTDTFNIPALLNRPQLNRGSYPAFYAATNPDGFKRVVILSNVRPVNMSTVALFWN